LEARHCVHGWWAIPGSNSSQTLRRLLLHRPSVVGGAPEREVSSWCWVLASGERPDGRPDRSAVTAVKHPIRLGIVDDYPVVVAGVASLLAGERIDVVETGTLLPVISDVDVVLSNTFGQGRGS
jgi:hypothetical protein